MSAPASFGQQRLWFMERLQPGSAAYLVSRAWHIGGPLDTDALCTAWRRLTSRQSVLRTSLAEKKGSAVQVVRGTGAEPRIVDLMDRSPQDARKEVDELVRTESGTPVDLTGAPARFTVVRLSPSRHVLILVLHHAATDGWSTGILYEELAEHYRAARTGSEASLPALPATYQEIARRQHERAAAPEQREALARWAAALHPLPEPPLLPLDHPRPQRPTGRGAMIRFDWGKGLADALQRVCREEGVTPFVVLLSALQALLHRFTGDHRVVVGTPSAGRNRVEEEPLVGFFVNSLPLCTDLSGDPAFRDLLRRAQSVLLDALDGQEVPFERIVEELDVPHDPGRHPLFDVMLVLQSVEERPPALDDVTLTPVVIDNGTSKFDLTLNVDRVDGTVSGWLEHRTDLFAPRTAERLLQQFATLLEAAVNDPGRRVTDLPLDRREQLAALASGADAIDLAPEPRLSVPEMVRRWAAQRPEAVAVDGDHPVTYRELAGRAARIADGLRSARVASGAPVAVRMAPGAPLVAALLGVLEAGCHFVCLPPGLPEDAAREVIEEAGPAALLTMAEDDPVRGLLDERGRPVLCGHLLTGPAVPGQALPEGGPALTDLAYLAFTSGTTGRPKGIAYPHAGLAQFVTWLAEEFGIGPGTRVAHWAGVGYDAAYGEIFSTLAAGATLCPVPPALRTDADRLGGWLAERDVHLLQTVPTFAAELAPALPARTGLRAVLLAGEVLTGDVVRRLRDALPDVRLANLYGPSETILATWHAVQEPPSGPVPVGRSIPGRQVLVLDDEGRPCPAGVPGRLVVVSPYMARGYVGRPEETRSAFRTVPGLPHPAYDTGDLGRRRADGVLEFLGRRDHQVKLHGVRLEPAEMEAVLCRHPAVRSAAVVAQRRADGSVGRLVAYLVPAEGSALAAGKTDWRAHLRHRFPEPSLPAAFVLLEELPRTVSGKVDQARLPQPAPDSGQGRDPQSELERRLCALMARVLDRDRVGADENFFAAGGHSLQATRLLNQVREQFGVDVPLHVFFNEPTAAALAHAVENPSAGDSELDDLLRQIGELSDDEARRMVEQFGQDG
ncbi:amino acid adenylation domain-containing protein [Streptomyces tendae]|uniref:non-ribosomal peptide synthetase n=1 Tax=Streptomyces tendae TaxID=1932 RepID=UPI00381738AA